MSRIPVSSSKKKGMPKHTVAPVPVLGELAEMRDEKHFSANSAQWLDLLIKTVNRSSDKICATRPLTLKDLDTLSPDLLKKILIFLLCGTGEYEESDFYPRRFEQLDPEHKYRSTLENVGFDPNMPNLYWRVKKLFSDYEDSFDYCILYFPAMNPKRTKTFLRCVMCYLIFVETVSEKFEATMDQCLLEIGELTATQQEIKLLQSQINAKIVQTEEWEAEMPTVKLTIERQAKEIEAQEFRLEQLEMKVKMRRKEYDVFESENVAIECNILSVESKIKAEEEKIVINPSVTIQKYNDEKELLNRALQERAALSEKRERLAEEDNLLTKIIDDTLQCVSELEEFTVKIQNTVEITEEALKAEKQYRGLRRRADEAEARAASSKAKLEKAKMLLVETKQNHEKEVAKKTEKFEELKSHLESLKLQSEENSVKLNEFVAVETSALAGIHKIQLEINKTEEYVNVTLPNEEQALYAKARADINEFVKLPYKSIIQAFNAGRATNNGFRTESEVRAWK